MKPINQQKIKFKNDCCCIVDYDLLEKAIIWYANDNVYCNRKIYMHGRYPCVSIFNKKIHVHRLIAMYVNKGRIASNIHAHHKDGNKMNASIDNIELMDASAHVSHHGKGKILSEDHKRKIGIASRKRSYPKRKRKYNIPYTDILNHIKDGKSILAISKIYGCDWSVIKQIIYANPELLNAK